MKRVPYFKLFRLVCIVVVVVVVADSLPGSTADSKTSGENKPISNDVLTTSDGMMTNKNNPSILGDSIIPSVRNTWTRSRAMLEKLWSKFRSSSGERSNRNLDSSSETPTPFYPKSASFANEDEYYPPYLSPTNRIPNRRYSSSMSQTYDDQRLPTPYYDEDQFMYPSRFPQDSYYQNQFASPYVQEPYRRRNRYRRAPYVQPPSTADDAMWYYRGEPVESNFQLSYYDAVPPRFYYQERQSRTTVPASEFTDFYDQF